MPKHLSSNYRKKITKRRNSHKKYKNKKSHIIKKHESSYNGRKYKRSHTSIKHIRSKGGRGGGDLCSTKTIKKDCADTTGLCQWYFGKCRRSAKGWEEKLGKKLGVDSLTQTREAVIKKHGVTPKGAISFLRKVFIK